MANAWTEKRLQTLFERYNTKYWNGRIQPYRVKLDPTRQGGYCDKAKRQILLGDSAVTSYHAVRKLLLHEMAHAVARAGHGPTWQTEMRRLAAFGVPGMSKELSCYLKRSNLIGLPAILSEVEDAATEPNMTWLRLKRSLISEYQLQRSDGTFLENTTSGFLEKCHKAYQRAR